LSLLVSYADAGADITSVIVRDLDGSIVGTGTFDFFPGTSGTARVTDLTIQPTVAGDHRLVIWAEDAKGSRSAKTSFTVTVQFF
ncbi:MAG TPA: hypothetical protein VN317_03815, partial [Candidatus Methanoperedens sp.]|nr:hypothetical protein [Candidatus Methanoperedens sp.]